MYPRRKDDDLYEEDTYDEEEVYQDERRRPLRGRGSGSSKRSSFGTIAFIFSLCVIVVAVVLYTYVFDSAQITIVPKYKDINDISKSFVFSRGGMEQSAIPFIVQTASISKSKTLSPSESRKVEAKASGKVTVYNNYDSSPQKLIKNTRFESSKGKIYRINQSISIPGKKGGVPGSIEVTLYADSTGSEYNIDTTRFTIPGFKGTPRENAFYAKSKGPIAGGSSGSMSLVSISDLNAAKDSFAVELTKDVQSEVMKIKKEGYIPLYTVSEVVFEDNEQDVLKGVTSEYKVTATGNLMLANGPKLAEALAKTLGDYDGAPVRVANVEGLTFTRKQSDHISTGSGTIPILVEGKSRVVWQSDTDSIKELVKGKRRDEFKPLMKTVNSVESAEISFSPLWLSTFPSDLSKLIVTESLPKR
jgi:hypothetical protein